MPQFVYEEEPVGYARIKVVGVGGGGCNAVDSMYDLGLQGVEFYVINSDLQALKRSKCPNRIQIGSALTSGRGCGADPSLGEKCMIEATELIQETLSGADIVFVTAGLGGGTGTGAAPVVAKIAREMGILTVSVVTKPFKFEGPRRLKSALAGLERLREASDTMIVVNNERLLDVVGAKAAMKTAFDAADKVLSQAVLSISDLVMTPGLINVDFNDIRTIMGGKGGAVMGVGMGKGESRAAEAVKKATNSPLLDKVVIDGATGLLICITGGPDMTLAEVSEATQICAAAADPDAEIIFGAVIDENMGDSMRVTLIATGFSDELHRQRELARAFESAPVARPHAPVAAAATPAPAARVQAAPAPTTPAFIQPSIPSAKEFESILDAMDQAGEDPSSDMIAPPPAAPAAAPVARKQSALSSALGQMMEEESTAGPVRSANAPIRPAAPAPIRVAKPNGAPKTNGAPLAPVTDSRVRVAAPEPAAAPATVAAPVATEAPEAKDDYDTPAFLRRRRSLFD